MKRIHLPLAAMLAIVVLVSAGCEGTIYSTPIKTENGTLTIGGRTGFFGTDQGVALYEEDKPAKPAPDKLVLQKAWRRQATIQDYDQKCPDPKQLRNIHTRTENVAESWAEEVPNPHKRAPQAQLIGGTNPSTGNLAVPALFIGGGEATQGFLAPGTNVVTTAIGKGGKGGSGGQGGKGGAGGSSSSSSSSSSSAAAAAAAAAAANGGGGGGGHDHGCN